MGGLEWTRGKRDVVLKGSFYFFCLFFISYSLFFGSFVKFRVTSFVDFLKDLVVSCS